MFVGTVDDRAHDIGGAHDGDDNDHRPEGLRAKVLPAPSEESPAVKACGLAKVGHDVTTVV